MLPDTLPQLIDILLRLPHLGAAELRELIQHLPDPQASAQEMVRRGWITQDQFSSLFPTHGQRPTPRETILDAFQDEASDADGDDWGLPLSDDEDKAAAPPAVAWALPDRTDEEMRAEPETVEALSLPSGEATTAQFEPDQPAPPVAADNETRGRESDTEKLRLWQWMGWAGQGLLISACLLGSFFAGLKWFGVNFTAPPAARQEFRQAK